MQVVRLISRIKLKLHILCRNKSSHNPIIHKNLDEYCRKSSASSNLDVHTYNIVVIMQIKSRRVSFHWITFYTFNDSTLLLSLQTQRPIQKWFLSNKCCLRLLTSLLPISHVEHASRQIDFWRHYCLQPFIPFSFRVRLEVGHTTLYRRLCNMDKY